MFSQGVAVAEMHEPHKMLGQVVSSNEQETIVITGGRRVEFYTNSLVLYTPAAKEKKYPEFERELQEIIQKAEAGIKNVLLSESRVLKHKPFTWKDEPENEHLRKCIRHILTYQLTRDGQQTQDNEEHLNKALCRLTMVIAKKN